MLKLALLALVFADLAMVAAADVVLTQRPGDFVVLNKLIPAIQSDIRYYSSHNFVGRRIHGYDQPLCLLTYKAATALRTVEEQLLPMGLTLKVYDCYRPQSAVDDFVKWAGRLDDTAMRHEFYPALDKSKLFSEGYIASKSGHSRGSTLDLTIVPVASKIPLYNPKLKTASCTAAVASRSPDNSLDFGSGFDCFSPQSHPDYQQISAQAKANRLLLQLLMKQAGFKPLATEWWHFTLMQETYPNSYFDFPIRASA